MTCHVGVPWLFSRLHFELPTGFEQHAAELGQKADIDRREQMVKCVVAELSEIHEVIFLEISSINVRDQLDDAEVHGAPKNHREEVQVHVGV